MDDWCLSSLRSMDDWRWCYQLASAQTGSDPDTLKTVGAIGGILIGIASLLWNYLNARKTRKLQLVITNNQFKQKLFEKLIFEPICQILREYHDLLQKIEAAYTLNKAQRIVEIKKIQHTELANLRLKLERELFIASQSSLVANKNLHVKAIYEHDEILDGFNAMCNDSLTESELHNGKVRTSEAANQLIISVIEMMIQASRTLVDDKIPSANKLER